MRWVFAQGMHHVRFVIDSYCSAHPTGALRLSCAVPWQVRNMCFPSSFFSLLYLHTFLDENVTWWKSIKDGKCIRNENERSPDLHRAKVESELLNITIKLNVTDFREFTKVLMKARVWAWLLLPICNYMERSCSGLGSVEIENYTSRHSSIMHYANWNEKKRQSVTLLRGITSNQAHPVDTYEPWWAKLAPSLCGNEEASAN